MAAEPPVKRPRTSYTQQTSLLASIHAPSGAGMYPDPTTSSSSVLHAAPEWSNDHEFMSPNEMYMKAIGLLFCLTTKRLLFASFTSLYRRSSRKSWTDILESERKNLKPNMSSVAKCFMLNRLLRECSTDPGKFAQETGQLDEEIKMRMSSAVTSPWNLQDFYDHVLARRNLQCQRRLFHVDHSEANQPPSVLTLQRVASELCSQLLTTYRTNPTLENYTDLQKFLEHSFVIVAQPSIPECVAATKYKREKLNGTYSAKLNTRIICLIDPEMINQYFTLFDVGVTLRPCDPNVDTAGDEQPALQWVRRVVVDSDEVQRSFYYVELKSIELHKTALRNSRPLYGAQLCRFDFNLIIRINEINFNFNLPMSSQLFGICSHAQYYPKYVTKVILLEVTEMPQSSGSFLQPNILANYIHRYHTRVTGVEIKAHTSQYIENILRMAYDQRRTLDNATLSDIYEEIVARLVSQMELYIDHPFLTMMYHDGLFLGICDHTLDQQLLGTREQPHVLLRFNELPTQEPEEHASVRFIVHNGQLIKATFHIKAFLDEMCRMICEANTAAAHRMQLFFENTRRNFHDFSWYFDNQLYRLHEAASPLLDAHKPLIPVLWNIMRISTGEQEPNLSSPIFSSTTDTITTSHEATTPQTERIVRQLVEKLHDLLSQSSTPTLLPTVINGIIEQQREFLSRLLSDSFAPRTQVDVVPQVTHRILSVTTSSASND